jgi:GWxTD domain-containing protein
MRSTPVGHPGRPSAVAGRRSSARLAAVWVVLALATVAPALAFDPDAGDGEGPGPLPWRVQGRVEFTVDAASFPDSAGRTLEVYLRLPPITLARLTRDEAGVGRIRLTMRVTNRFGGRAQERSEEIPFAGQDTVAGLGRVVIMRFPARPGTNRLRVRVEDLLSRKHGIGYIGRKVSESETVEGEVIVPEAQAGRDLSDLEFLWTRTAAGGASEFRRGEHVVIPNPERLYGLLATEVRAEFAARGLPGDERAWHWHARVLDASGGLVGEQQGEGPAASRLSGVVAIDISMHPAGGYDLELKAWQDGDTGALIRVSHFGIGWRASTWLVDPSEFDDAVHFLLSAEEEQRFARMHVGERERFLEDFWRRRDPTPETAENEARLQFQARVQHANVHFDSATGERGMFSDMGRVYIRYGEPDEVLKQVIPAGDETLDQVIQQLELTEDRPTGDVHQKGLGGDTRPYEVWVYENIASGPPDTDPARLSQIRPRHRMVFLFVDEHGYGTYILRYSTE